MPRIYYIILLVICSSELCCGQYCTPQTAKEIFPRGNSEYEVALGTGIGTQSYARYVNSGKGSDSINKFYAKFSAWFTFKFEKDEVMCFTWRNADQSRNCSFNFILYEFNGTGDELMREVQAGNLRPIRLAIQGGSNPNNPIVAGGLSRMALDTIATTDWQNPYLRAVGVTAGSQYFLVIQVNGLDGPPSKSLQLTAEPHFNLCFSDSCSLRGFLLRNLNFESGKATLTGRNTQLDELATMLKKNPFKRVQITGHTDNTGSEPDNLKLSLERAEAVKKYLVGKGVKAVQISTEGLGSSKPLVPNNTEGNKAINRRVQLTISD